MPSLLVRSGKKREVWLRRDPVEICDHEFHDGFESELSVYRIDDPDHLTRVYSEHIAGESLGLKGGFAIDFTSTNKQAAHRPLKNFPFAFAANQHHEIPFADRQELEMFIRDTILPDLPYRWRDVEKQDIREYVRKRLAVNDSEWKNVTFTGPNATAWNKLLGRP